MRTIFISGVNKGFGFCMLEHFLKKGDYVIGTYRTKNKEIENLAKKYHSTFELHYMDLSDFNTIDMVFSNIKKDRIDCIINNAASSEGVGPIYKYNSLTERIFKVNLFGHMRVVSNSIKNNLLYKQSSIINITSYAAFKTYKLLGLYCISKASFEAYTKSLAFELQEKGIRVNSVGISAHTDLYIQHALEKEKLGYTNTIDRIRKGEKLPSPKNALKVIEFLSSDESCHITSQHIECNFMDVMLV